MVSRRTKRRTGRKKNRSIKRSIKRDLEKSLRKTIERSIKKSLNKFNKRIKKYKKKKTKKKKIQRGGDLDSLNESIDQVFKGEQINTVEDLKGKVGILKEVYDNKRREKLPPRDYQDIYNALDIRYFKTFSKIGVDGGKKWSTDRGLESLKTNIQEHIAAYLKGSSMLGTRYNLFPNSIDDLNKTAHRYAQELLKAAPAEAAILEAPPPAAAAAQPAAAAAAQAAAEQEQARVAAEQEQARVAAEQEQARVAAEQVEQERLAAERAEQEQARVAAGGDGHEVAAGWEPGEEPPPGEPVAAPAPKPSCLPDPDGINRIRKRIRECDKKLKECEAEKTKLAEKLKLTRLRIFRMAGKSGAKTNSLEELNKQLAICEEKLEKCEEVKKTLLADIKELKRKEQGLLKARLCSLLAEIRINKLVEKKRDSDEYVDNDNDVNPDLKHRLELPDNLLAVRFTYGNLIPMLVTACLLAGVIEEAEAIEILRSEDVLNPDKWIASNNKYAVDYLNSLKIRDGDGEFGPTHSHEPAHPYNEFVAEAQRQHTVAEAARAAEEAARAAEEEAAAAAAAAEAAAAAPLVPELEVAGQPAGGLAEAPSPAPLELPEEEAAAAPAGGSAAAAAEAAAAAAAAHEPVAGDGGE
jgi:hypothetical protein